MRAGVVVLLGLVTGCGEVPMLEELAPDRSCRRTVTVGPVGRPVTEADAEPQAQADPEAEATQPAAARAGRGAAADHALDASAEAADTGDADVARDTQVEWRSPTDAVERQRLNAWCAAVGPAVVGGWAPGADGPVDSLAVVAWNVHVGGGDLTTFVRDLRAGRLTGGGPVEHFVLLLQEAYREGELVPRFDAALPFGGGVVAAPPHGRRQDIVADAEDLGLSVFYAPSMRNGEGPEVGEDRGNAILSTLPIEEPMAVELPVARQRRVAIAAYLSGETRAGEPWRLQAASVHFENDASGWLSDERARLVQGEALLEALGDDAEIAIAAGDFNTWARAHHEEVIRTYLRAYPDTPPFPPGHTYAKALVVRRYLDYIFFRVPDGGRTRYHRAPGPYASDHFPLVGWVVFPAGD